MVAELAALIVGLVVGVVVASGEWWHARRIRRVALLAFGPSRRARSWTRLAPWLRTAAAAALAWGLATLWLLPPKTHSAAKRPDNRLRHVILVLDVSPSMQLADAGPSGQQTRRQRAADLLQSFFERISVEQYRVTVVAVYTGAKPVVLDTQDREVVRNVLNDLPMEFAFRSGETYLFAGLEEAARIARAWEPASTTLVLLSDGDTVPATGMPNLPAAIANVLVVGVGDVRTGKFINGRQSRQDASTLRQIAIRLQGSYHDGNQNHIPSDTLRALTAAGQSATLRQLTRREYALLAAGLGGLWYAGLPWLLALVGTRWRPGVTRPRIPGDQSQLATETAGSENSVRGRPTSLLS